MVHSAVTQAPLRLALSLLCALQLFRTDALASINSSKASGSFVTKRSTVKGSSGVTSKVVNHTPAAPLDGADAIAKCNALRDFVPKDVALNDSLTFAQYWPAGSNPSLELLAATYPAGLLPEKPATKSLVSSIAPDVDLTRDVGYGWSDQPFSKNGPLGGLPPFCRYGALVKTSDYTQALVEVWLPIKYNPELPLATVNTSDYPTNSTPVALSETGKIIKGPSYLISNDTLTQIVQTTANDHPDADGTTQAFYDLKGIDSSGVLVKRKKGQHHPDEHGHGHHPHGHHGHDKNCIFTGKQVLGDPKKGWNGRLITLSNGGMRGYIPHPGMKQLMSRYGAAVAGTNLGHWSATSGVTWINGTELYTNNVLVDWGSRAIAGTKLLADEIIAEFYKSPPVSRFLVGCSQGGRSGITSALDYPDFFDGILSGSPALDVDRLNTAELHFQKQHRKNTTKEGWFDTGKLIPVHKTILSQCDKLDGVEDGVLRSPEDCQVDFEKDLLCGQSGGLFNDDEKSCLNSSQLAVLKETYQPTYFSDGQLVYPAYPIGWEQQPSQLSGDADRAANFFELAVLRAPRLNRLDFDPYGDKYEGINASVLALADAQKNLYATFDPFLADSLLSGTKIISYHGLADGQISPYRTRAYYEEVEAQAKEALQGDLQDYYRHYEIPGMSHCRGGVGPWHFGGQSQLDGGNRPLRFDTRHDILLSLIAWSEKGKIADYQVGAHYHQRTAVVPEASSSSDDSADGSTKDPVFPNVFEDYSYGIVNTRKLCPLPTKAVYKGGPVNGTEAWKSFECE